MEFGSTGTPFASAAGVGSFCVGCVEWLFGLALQNPRSAPAGVVRAFGQGLENPGSHFFQPERPFPRTTFCAGKNRTQILPRRIRALVRFSRRVARGRSEVSLLCRFNHRPTRAIQSAFGNALGLARLASCGCRQPRGSFCAWRQCHGGANRRVRPNPLPESCRSGRLSRPVRLDS